MLSGKQRGKHSLGVGGVGGVPDEVGGGGGGEELLALGEGGGLLGGVPPPDGGVVTNAVGTGGGVPAQNPSSADCFAPQR